MWIDVERFGADPMTSFVAYLPFFRIQAIRNF